MAFGIPASLLGLVVKGDLAGQTLYTDRFGRKTWFPQAPPKEPPSPLQTQQRNRFKSAQAAWAALTDQEKSALEQCTHILSLCCTGQNLYIALALKQDQAAIDTIARQSGLVLPTITLVPYE